METIKGKIRKKEIKSGETNDKSWKRCIYVIEDKVLSTFDTKFMNFKEGDEVEMQYEVKGNFNNILNAMLLKPNNKKIKKFIVTVEELE